MTPIRWTSFALAGAAVLVVSTGFLAEPLPWLIISGVLLVIWLVALWRHWHWLASISLVILTGLAAVGLYEDAAPLVIVGGMILGLCAWSAGQFAWRTKDVPVIDHQAELARSFALRLAAVAGISMALAFVALTITIDLTFGLVLLAGVIVVVALSQVLRLLRQGSAP